MLMGFSFPLHNILISPCLEWAPVGLYKWLELWIIISKSLVPIKIFTPSIQRCLCFISTFQFHFIKLAVLTPTNGRCHVIFNFTGINFMMGNPSHHLKEMGIGKFTIKKGVWFIWSFSLWIFSHIEAYLNSLLFSKLLPGIALKSKCDIFGSMRDLHVFPIIYPFWYPTSRDIG